MTPEVGRALLSAVDVLDGLSIRYAIVGGLAVGAWGVNRSTRDRRKSVDVAGKALWFITPEDLAVLKAFSERPRDFEDLVNLSAVVGARLDVAYIRRWAKQLDESIGGNDVSERVESALAHSKPKAPQGKPKRPRKK